MKTRQRNLALAREIGAITFENTSLKKDIDLKEKLKIEENIMISNTFALLKTLTHGGLKNLMLFLKTNTIVVRV